MPYIDYKYTKNFCKKTNVTVCPELLKLFRYIQ